MLSEPSASAYLRSIYAQDLNMLFFGAARKRLPLVAAVARLLEGSLAQTLRHSSRDVQALVLALLLEY